MASARLIWQAVLLLFSPARFVREAADHDTRLPPAQNLTGEALTWDRVIRIRCSLATAFSSVVLSLTLGWVSGVFLIRTVGPASRTVIALLQLLAACIILGATLAVLDWETRSFTGQTLPEKVNRCLYRLLYVVGTYLLVLSLRWVR
jgi:hypothetical protein